jgi:hypothetical protein
MLKKLRQNKPFRVLCRQILNAVLIFLVTCLGNVTGEWQVIAVGLGVPILNIITKWINTNIFGDLGVEKVNE